MRGVRGVLGVLAVLDVLAGWAPTREARRRPHDPITTKITFAREIRAILQTRCAGCHAAGGPAPMPLTTLEEVRPWARAIKTQTLTRRMPKWHAARGYGAFGNDPSLTPAEVATIAAWVDGGLPPGTPASAPASSDPAVRSFRQRAAPLTIPPSAMDATVRVPQRWIGGWYFEPGDPLITSAVLTSADGATIATWVAGDAPVELPGDAGVRVTSPVRVRMQRRQATDYEKPVPPKRSLLRLLPRTEAPPRRVWTERTTCGAPRTGRQARLLAVRPLLDAGSSTRVWLERPGAPRTIIGWFREYETLYPRTYWLSRAADLMPESRVQADTACMIELTLASR